MIGRGSHFQATHEPLDFTGECHSNAFGFDGRKLFLDQLNDMITVFVCDGDEF